MAGRSCVASRRCAPTLLWGLLLALAGCVGDEQTINGSPVPDPTTPGVGSPAASVPPSPPDPTPFPLRTGPDALALELVADGFVRPLGVLAAGDGGDRLFVVEQDGVIRILDVERSVLPDPFLELTGRVESGGNEQGLLGLAFHPDHARNGRLFVNYTRQPDGATVVAEYRVAASGQRVDPGSERVLLEIPQPFANHNGGQLAFGPDGYLYVALGDGGGANDPRGNGQDPATLLGTLLRLDVDGSSPGRAYAVPDDNPFADGGGAAEVWAYGLRNPWRFSFDRRAGDLYIADVGQGGWEEVNRQPVDSAGGENYGWPVMEGRHCTAAEGCDQSPYALPIAEYPLDGACAIVGGHVYRGSAQPELVGVYLFADHCTGEVMTLQVDEGTITPKPVLQSGLTVTSFGEDEAGEVYLVAREGGIYRVLVD